jgi:probable addiction module antidote protein
MFRKHKKMKEEIITSLWDVADHLKTEEDIVAYFEAVLEVNDPLLSVTALIDIARARGISKQPDKLVNIIS